MSRFYFALVDKEENEFLPEHKRMDEVITAGRLRHGEGSFATLDIDLLNPKVPLLGPGRKRWAWFAWEDDEGNVYPLFFGRVTGLPLEISAEVIRLSFVARPLEYEARKEEVAEPLRALPAFDPLWIDAGERDDPDRVLDAIPRVWHIDRTTHEVTTSHVLEGEDGTEVFGQDEVIYSSLSAQMGAVPLKKVIVDTSVRWDQVGTGLLDLTPEIRSAIKSSQGDVEVNNVNLEASPTGDTLLLLSSDALISAWPRKGQAFGGGWEVGESQIKIIGGWKPAVAPTYSVTEFARLMDAGISSGAGRYFPSVVLPVKSLRTHGSATATPEIALFPVTKTAVSLQVRWNASVARVETARVEVTADVQAILAEPTDQEVLRVTMPQASVDERVDSLGEMPIGDPRRLQYFTLDRGRYSMENLMMRAHAHLTMRSRALNVSFTVPFARGVGLSLRKSGTVTDDRLPGGSVTGKIISYTLDFVAGRGTATVVLGCSVGRGGVVTTATGDPVYASAGYVAPGYQKYEGATLAPVDGQLAYDDYSTTVELAGSHLDLQLVSKDRFLKSVEVYTGWEAVKQIMDDSAKHTAEDISEAVSRVDMLFRVEMEPVSGGPYITEYAPTMQPVKLPLGVDVEGVE